ncbi:MAG: FAD-binding protein [Solibacillus sp.]
MVDYDVIIVGCGAAGTAAALAAAEEAKQQNEALSIAILERAPFDKRGGNTRWTAAYMRMENIDTPAVNFVEDMLKFSDHYIDREYAETLQREAGETLRWVESKGVEFDFLPTMFLTSAKPRLLPVGGGRAIIDTLSLRARALGVEFIYEATAWDLTQNDEGAINGIKVRIENGSVIHLKTNAVILAAGGFQGNKEMMAQYVGRDAYKIPPVSEGGLFNKGEAIRMAMRLGAAGKGQFDSFHAETVDPRSKREEAGVMLYPYGILVNKQGERFTDEGVTTIDEQYEEVARKIFYNCEDHIAYMITDQKIYDIPNYEEALQTDIAAIVGDTIEELADKIQVPAAALKATVEEFNVACPAGEFLSHKIDGLATTNLALNKSNWSIPINKGPYIAYPIICCNVFTNGGLATDLQARVLTGDDVAIPGLYAVGETQGVYYGKYPGGTSVLRCLVYGRRAGADAIRYVNESAKSYQ